MRYLLVFILFSCKLLAFDKVIIWGHKLHSHTHSYVHNAFYKAFKHMGYDTYWFDSSDDVASFDFSNSLFLTEGQADKGIPLRDDCRYILHNCDSKYQSLVLSGKAYNLQVYTDDVLQRAFLEKIAPCIYGSAKHRILHMPWATDLLPDEIEANKKRLLSITKERASYWVGTIGDGTFGNKSELLPFMKACKENHIRFIHKTYVSEREHEKLIMRSIIAPAIVGEWQKRQGYIPCRIFKNISYGQMGATNSKRVFELFDGKILYDSNTYSLGYKAFEFAKNVDNKTIFDLMDFVKLHHTYINRIELMINFLEEVEAQCAL